MDLLYTAHVPAGEGPFPTLFALHGWGANAHDLLGLAPFLHGGQALILCPEGPVRVDVGPELQGRGWFPIRSGAAPDLQEFQEGADALRRFLEESSARYPIDPRKTVLLGFSQGGVMAYDLALRDPARFAGLVALSSWLPPAVASLPGRSEHAGLPILVIHGTEDPMIPVDRARESRDALLRLGVALTYREYAMGHEIRPEALREIMTWLEEKVLHPIQLA
jgi:phospholipase/carboxylesterase